MKYFSMGLAVILLPTASMAQFSDSRNRAMGGTGVASSHYAAAGFINPALLTRYNSGDRFAVIFPSFGVGVTDKDGLVDAIDEFQQQVDRVQTALNNATATQQMRDDLADSLNNLGGRTAAVDLSAGLSVAFPSKGFAWSFIASSYGEGVVGVQIDPTDDAKIRTATNAAVLDTIQSEGRVLGGGITEIGFAFATELAPGLSIGVTPKAQRIDTYNYAIDVNNFDEDDYDNSRFRQDQTEFNVDLGAAFRASDLITVGLSVRNALSHDVKTAVIAGSQFTRTVEPRITLGAAVDAGFGLFTADVDVVDFDRIKEIANDESQFVRAGVEFGWKQIAQLRLGIQHDFEDTIEDLFTAGIGISPLNTVHIDVSGHYGSGDTYGGMVQLWFTF